MFQSLLNFLLNVDWFSVAAVVGAAGHAPKAKTVVGKIVNAAAAISELSKKRNNAE